MVVDVMSTTDPAENKHGTAVTAIKIKDEGYELSLLFFAGFEKNNLG
jgi:hypothetical protein